MHVQHLKCNTKIITQGPAFGLNKYGWEILFRFENNFVLDFVLDVAFSTTTSISYSYIMYPSHFPDMYTQAQGQGVHIRQIMSHVIQLICAMQANL